MSHKESDMTEQLSLHFTSLFWFFPDKYLEVELLRYGRDACTQLCLTLRDPMDCSPLGSSAHRIFQERRMEWVVISFSRGSCHPGIKPVSPALAGGFFTTSTTLVGHEGKRRITRVAPDSWGRLCPTSEVE